jgi:integrase/recombinase XerD
MTDTSISPLRRRMIEDMTIRGFTAATQRSYLVAVMSFTAFFGRPPDAASVEDLRRYQVHMRSIGTSPTGMNAAVSGLRFFFGVTLERGDAHAGMTTVREPKTLPVILSPQEVARLLDAAPGFKYRAALSVAYGAGLRASEVISLKIGVNAGANFHHLAGAKIQQFGVAEGCPRVPACGVAPWQAQRAGACGQAGQ